MGTREQFMPEREKWERFPRVPAKTVRNRAYNHNVARKEKIKTNNKSQPNKNQNICFLIGGMEK